MNEDKIVFEDQRADEEIILITRQHPWVLAKSGLVLVVMGLIIFASFKIAWASAFSAWVTMIMLVLAIIYSVIRWYLYSNDIFVLTNQRIIKIDQMGFFSRRVGQTELDNIYNISYEVRGIVESFLNFGDIMISTVGDDISTMTVKRIENPHFVQEKILSEHRKYKIKNSE